MLSGGIGYVIGLGNPGRRYRRTRHNLGFAVVEELVRRWHVGPPRRAFNGLLWETQFGLQRVRLLEPTTFMNGSGQAVAQLAGYYDVEPCRMLIVLDDLALPAGTIRLRSRGSAGGHKGLADILKRLDSDQVPRLRLGIGQPPPEMDPVAYVLGVVSQEELPLAEEAIAKACLAVEDWLSDGIEAAMNKYN